MCGELTVAVQRLRSDRNCVIEFMFFVVSPEKGMSDDGCKAKSRSLPRVILMLITSCLTPYIRDKRYALHLPF